MESCLPLITTVVLIFVALGTAWAQEEATTGDSRNEKSPPSNIESWNEDEELAPTWFGMGFETRKSYSSQMREQNTERLVNN